MIRPPARRAEDIRPFYVMALLGRARELEAAGRSIVHMEIGEPDFPTPDAVVRAGIEALRAGHTHYTAAAGLPALREAIARSYPAPARPDPRRVVVTPGSSGALQLALMALVNPGERVLVPDPGYPCNRHFVRLVEGEAVPVPLGPESGYRLTPEAVADHWDPRCAATMIASPANPTGAVLEGPALGALVEAVEARGGMVIADEIYHGLYYGTGRLESVLEHSGEAFVVNSFSKYHGMTGWRLGWLVAPEAFVPVVEKLAQNLFLAASTPAQYAALAAFRPEVQAELRRRVAVFRERRDYLVPALRALGFGIPEMPAGAFYVYADCSAFTDDSFRLARDLLEQAGVAVTPGLDFGRHRPGAHLRFSYAAPREDLEEGVARTADFLRRHR